MRHERAVLRAVRHAARGGVLRARGREHRRAILFRPHSLHHLVAGSLRRIAALRHRADALRRCRTGDRRAHAGARGGARARLRAGEHPLLRDAPPHGASDGAAGQKRLSARLPRRLPCDRADAARRLPRLQRRGRPCHRRRARRHGEAGGVPAQDRLYRRYARLRLQGRRDRAHALCRLDLRLRGGSAARPARGLCRGARHHGSFLRHDELPPHLAAHQR